MRAFLDFLPEGGRESVARDVLKCGDDDDDGRLYEVFRDLKTALLQPSKFLPAKTQLSNLPAAPLL